ncbi:MAG: DUF3857 domain-containing protein [Dysgonamonadaceae bacterium]|jgi:hypothetical protein|nr:DUF3857 domain-containing protein [Dysgonamonadaceae bacterium]
MKKFTLIFGLILCAQFLVAQEKFKFGNVPQDLLEMTVYAQDSTASAFVVYENNDVYYNYNNANRDFEIVTDYTVRIKILTQDGVDYANGSILFYKGRTAAASESINGLNGATYNLENGKIVTDKLSKEYIFTEDVTDYVKRMKFALPAVKIGSVIEYKYTLKSPHYENPNDFQFQRSIPVKYSHFEITIPEYFTFNRETKGYEPINVSVKPTNLNFNMNGSQVNCSGEKISAEVFDLPALKDENFVWNYNDFMSSISFELQRISIAGRYYKDFSQTWNKIAERLSDSDNFGKELKNKGLFKEELPGIIASEGNDEDKLRAILDLVRSKVKWNDRSTLGINSVSKALKEGVGTSSEINAILFNALQNAGYTVSPVVMSLRSRGRIPMTYPSIENLNYFVVQVKAADKVYYMDATRSYCDLNVIPVDCLVDKALCINDKNFTWIDLSKTGNNAERSSLIVSFNEDGVLTGKKIESYVGECAFSFKQRYGNAKDEAEFVEKLETNNDIVISNYSIEEKKNPTFGFTESYEFTSNNNLLGDETIITLPPLLFETMKTNPFKSEERKLPIEFNYPEDDRMNINIAIPNGYVLDEAPVSARFIYGDNNEMEFSYMVQANETNVQIAYRLKLATCVIPATDYEGVRDFMSKVYAKCHEMLIFKKL